MVKLIGYIRTTEHVRDLQLQLDALIDYGCLKENIFIDNTRGQSQYSRLDVCLDNLQEGDTLMVWRLDIIGRSMHHLFLLMDELNRKGIGFKSICDETIDTTKTKDLFDIFFSLDQFAYRVDRSPYIRYGRNKTMK